MTSQFTLNALAGVPYTVVVDGRDDGVLPVNGAYRLTLSPGACPECVVDGDCVDGRLCAESQCVECTVDADCPDQHLCTEQRCLEPAQMCDAENPCPATDFFFGTLGQDCDLSLGGPDQGICVDMGMCRDPIPIKLASLWTIQT